MPAWKDPSTAVDQSWEDLSNKIKSDVFNFFSLCALFTFPCSQDAMGPQYFRPEFLVQLDCAYTLPPGHELQLLWRHCAQHCNLELEQCSCSPPVRTPSPFCWQEPYKVAPSAACCESMDSRAQLPPLYSMIKEQSFPLLLKWSVFFYCWEQLLIGIDSRVSVTVANTTHSHILLTRRRLYSHI